MSTLFICLCEDDGIDGVGVHKIGDLRYWPVLVNQGRAEREGVS